MELTKRLQEIVSYVPKGASVADIGTDHGYIPIYLSLNTIASHVIAMDVNKDPLEKARKNGEAYRADKSITYRQSDGLEKLEPGEVQCVIIAGMGGKLIERILEENHDKLRSFERLILSPHRDIDALRAKLRQLRMPIVKESMVFEDGHYYNIMVVEPDLTQKQTWTALHAGDHDQEKTSEYTESDEFLIKIYDKYGKLLIDEKNELLLEQIQKQVKKQEKLLETLRRIGQIQRGAEIEEELVIGRKVITWLK